jgi:endonuclease YncB( thermonuclease family)
MDALIFCLIVGVIDGDTLKARCGEHHQTTIRLAEIDAPEKSQAYGEQSRQHLAALCFHKQAAVRVEGMDRFGRTIARISCTDRDASIEQVSSGMAWAFTKYLKDPAVKSAESQARALSRGLWTDPAPVAPWAWRRTARPAKL